MKRFALLGLPVEHSVSPAIYRAAFGALELDALYEPVPVSEEVFLRTMRQYAASGGGNVTLPHKRRAAASLAHPSRAVLATGACNCFWGRGEQIAGDNTDVYGFRQAAEEFLGPGALAGAEVLLLGAGGAARAVLVACLCARVGRVDVWNRTPGRARELLEEIASRWRSLQGSETGVRLNALASRPRAGSYDLVVNATRLGLGPQDPPPLLLDSVSARSVLDLVYAPGGTVWSREARSAGIPAQDGLSMLVHQAARSLERWFPGVTPPLSEMRAAAAEELASRLA